MTAIYITPECIVCHQASTIGVTDEVAAGIRAWKAGRLAQVALSMLSADERELIMTGIHPDCWSQLADDDDDETDDDYDGETVRDAAIAEEAFWGPKEDRDA